VARSRAFCQPLGTHTNTLQTQVVTLFIALIQECALRTYSSIAPGSSLRATPWLKSSPEKKVFAHRRADGARRARLLVLLLLLLALQILFIFAFYREDVWCAGRGWSGSWQPNSAFDTYLHVCIREYRVWYERGRDRVAMKTCAQSWTRNFGTKLKKMAGWVSLLFGSGVFFPAIFGLRSVILHELPTLSLGKY
jgi:hypothetical protein